MRKIFIITFVTVVAFATSVSAQVSFTPVLDALVDVGGSVYASDYNPGEDVFLASQTGSTVHIINGATGAITGTMDLSIPAPSGLGIFAIACADDSRTFAYDAGAGNLWLYPTTASNAPTTAATGVAFARTGTTVGSGANTVVVLTGAVSNGSAEIYTTADGLNYTLADTAAVQAKSGIDVNYTVTKTWAVGDTGGNNIQTFEGSIGGSWTEETVNWPTTTDADGSGPIAYDDENNILFAVPMGGTNNGNIYALDGDTGVTLGSDTFTTAAYSTVTGYDGAYANGNTVAAVARGVPSSSAACVKYNYAVTGKYATVEFTNVLDALVDIGGSVYASDYNPTEDVFLASQTGSTVHVINGATGAITGTMDLSIPAPSGLGIFAIACADDGRTFAYDAGAGKMWLYSTTASNAPTTAATGVAFARTGDVKGAGASTIVVLTGAASNGSAEIYTTADGLNYTLADTAAVQAKSGIAVNSSVTKTWAVGDTGGNNIQKFYGTIGGDWTEAVSWPTTTDADGSGPLGYDETNNVLIAVPMGGTNNGNIYALDANSGETLGSAAILTAVFSTVTGYDGGYADGSVAAGVARGNPSSSAACVKYTYTYTDAPSGLSDWTVF